MNALATSSKKPIGGADSIDAILLRLDSCRDSYSGSFVLGLTSCHRRAGVSTIAGKMAIRAAELSLGKTLLIDGNLEFPKQARNFSLKRTAGFAEALADGSIEDKVYNGVADGLYVMPAGAPANRRVNLTPDICGGLIKELREQYSLIFVDLPPISSSARFLMLARQTDGLALVADARTTRARSVLEAQRLLEGSGTSIIGTILNRKIRTLPKWLDRWV